MLKKDSVFIVTKQNLYDAGDAIREKTGYSDPIQIKDLDEAIDSIEGGGGSEDLDALLNGTLTAIRSNITTLRTQVFHDAGLLTTVDLPEVLEVGAAALQNSGITTLNMPKLVTAGNSAFTDCKKLTEVNLPNMTTAGMNVFQNCNKVTTMNVPKLTKTNSYAMRQCSVLTEIVLPALTELSGNTFYQDGALELVDLPACTKITSGQFYASGNVLYFILRSTSGVCLNEASELFPNSKIGQGTGHIYVPQALIDQYKAATNWARYETSFRALEDYTVDGTVTGALDPSKV